jgi:hypothetical protein
MKDIEYAIRYIPTKQWVKIWFGVERVYIHLMDEFYSDVIYSARNIIEEDLCCASWGDGRGRVDTKDFEIVKIEVSYKLPD